MSKNRISVSIYLIYINLNSIKFLNKDYIKLFPHIFEAANVGTSKVALKLLNSKEIRDVEDILKKADKH